MKDNAIVILLKLMGRNQFTQKKLSDNSGVHSNTINNWIARGNNPTADKWMACVEGMGYQIILEKKDGDERVVIS
jgi:hypothetical protein